MRKRIISAVLAIIALIFIMMQPPFVMGITVFAVSLIALYEFYQSVRKMEFYPVRIVGFFSCIMFLLYIISYSYESDLIETALGVLSRAIFQRNIVFLIIYIVVFYLMMQLIFNKRNFTLDDIAVTLLGIIYVPFLLSFVFLVRCMDNGFELVWIIFVGTFSTDIFAYFTGKLFGKKKLLPEVSPNKTVAGAIGGVVGSIVCTTAFGYFYVYLYAGIKIPAYHYILIGLLCGVIAQIGDWAASAIKRRVGIKDFGNIMPGHGGLLDRIDSLLFVAPAIYFYLQFFI
ncbi:MAG TPA: phosphatidate cytidylyltransferase [Ruminiclostridium sp.]|jgi:phosphatidate cytidylyltransferase|nr:phosphatidate cytidylyltransferase [Clostridiaceae bacterium]HAA24830.1 phosphatidate cytidylyltransferase [Ruminiclostridium sp.]